LRAHIIFELMPGVEACIVFFKNLGSRMRFRFSSMTCREAKAGT